MKVLAWIFFSVFFFFQAEDGIRDRDVTGVQTCALPIYVLRLVIAAARAVTPPAAGMTDGVHHGGAIPTIACRPQWCSMTARLVRRGSPVRARPFVPSPFARAFAASRRSLSVRCVAVRRASDRSSA